MHACDKRGGRGSGSPPPACVPGVGGGEDALSCVDAPPRSSYAGTHVQPSAPGTTDGRVQHRSSKGRWVCGYPRLRWAWEAASPKMFGEVTDARKAHATVKTCHIIPHVCSLRERGSVCTLVVRYR